MKQLNFKQYASLLLFLLLSLGLQASNENNSTQLSGKISDNQQQPIAGVSVYFPELKTGGITDIDGNYTIKNLPHRLVLIQIQAIGYKMIAEKIDLKTVLQKDFQLESAIIEMNEIVVTGQAGASQLVKMPTPVSVISPLKLHQTASTNIIDAICKQPGIDQISTGQGISKPVIRGLGYSRVVVMNDGVRQEGQQWGDEHGIEMDEFSVHRVEILKGPASLMYGSDAMAGVINFFPLPVLPDGTKRLNLLTNYQTNNGLKAYSIDFAGRKKTFLWDLRYSEKKAHDYQNKYDGFVYNSRFSEHALTAFTGINTWWGYSHLTASWYHLTPGIAEGERDATTGQFIREELLPDGSVTDISAVQSDFKSYKHAMPYQQVNHYKLVWNNNLLIGEGSLKATLGYQQNQRQEFEDISAPSQYGLYFKLHTLNYNFQYSIPEKNSYNLSFGLNGMYQHSQNKGSEYLVPEYRLLDAGAFIVGNRTIGKVEVSGGLRFDRRMETSDALYLDANETKVSAGSPDATIRFEDFSTHFNGISGSLGASYQLSKYWNTKINLSRGFRAPNISELASNGAHEGTIRYEIGNTKLKAEQSWQFDYQLEHSTEHVEARLNLFVNKINNFIFLRKLSSVLGGDSISENYSSFKFQSGNAILMGGELSVDIHPHPLDWLHIENDFSYVDTRLRNQPDSSRHLPFTPAPVWRTTLKAEAPSIGKLLRNAYFSVGTEFHFKQDKVYSAYNTETRTDGYILINAGIGADIIWKKRTFCSVYIAGTNLMDKAYQSHLSRLKYAPENPVTGRNGIFNMGRNISFKLIVPVEL